MSTIQGLMFSGFYKGNTLDIAPSGNFFVSTSRRLISVCDFKNKQVLCQIKASENIVFGISPNEKRCVFTEKGETRLVVREVNTLDKVASIDVDYASCLSFFSDSEILFFELTDSDFKCCCWNYLKNEINVIASFSRCLYGVGETCINHDKSISFILRQIDPDKIYKIYCFDNKLIKEKMFELRNNNSIRCAQMINDKILVCETTAHHKGSTYLYDLNTGNRSLICDRLMLEAYILNDHVFYFILDMGEYKYLNCTIDSVDKKVMDFSDINHLELAWFGNCSNDNFLILCNAYGSFVFQKSYEPIPNARLTIPALNRKLPGTEGLHFGKFTIK